MYFYQARESLDFWKPDLGEDLHRLYVNHMEAAQRFHLGNFKDYEDNKMLPKGSVAEAWSEDLKAPYDFTWIDFQDSTDEEFPKRGVLISNAFAPNGEAILEIIPFNEYQGKWVAPFLAAYVNLKDMDYIQYSILDAYKHAYANAEHGDFYYTMQTHMCMVHCFLRLINCKNIETEDVEPSAKLNRRRQKKGKKPFLSYKVLTIKAPGQGRAGSPGTGIGSKQRVHLCRGHFKTYTAEKPLMGKHTGTYWWQPTVRGQDNKGMVVKDYKLELSEQE